MWLIYSLDLKQNMSYWKIASVICRLMHQWHSNLRALSSELLTAAADVVSRDPPIASPGPESSSVVNRIPSISSLPESGMSSSSSLSDSSTYSAVSIEHPVGTNISCHTKVIVHPRGTNMTYPPGSIVLSMSDVNWVAVRTPESS